MQEEKIQIGTTIVKIYHGDIRDLSPDIMVSSDVTELTMDSGVAKAILDKGGPQIREEADIILARQKLSLGDVVVTNAGNLNAKKIFHAITFDSKTQKFVTPYGVTKATYTCLRKADDFASQTIAFPALGTGPGQEDHEAVSRSMLQTVFNYLGTTSTNLREITFSLYTQEAWMDFFKDFMYQAAKIKIEQAKPIRLTILRQREKNYFDLTSSDTISVIRTMKVPTKTLTKYAQALEDFVTTGKSKFADLVHLGQDMYEHLLGDIGDQIKNLPSNNLFLKLDDNLLSIPWELCHDGTDFLGRKYNIGRQVVVSPKFYIMSYPTRSLQYPLRVLLLADPTETLPGAVEECNKIHKELSKIDGIKENLEYKSGKEIKLDKLMRDLTNYDLVHYAGHAKFNKRNPSESGWEINPDRKEYLTASMMAAMNAPPIVFANACESGTQAVEKKLFYQGEIFGIASGFLMGGIKNYIGTFTYVNDVSSIDFAVQFYKKLITQGETVGSSLRHARKFIYEKHGEAHILWASYMLYGDPEFKLNI
ncbi:MAG: CHAT domain-containing protein [Candidatus Helarchaeota archaeon]|nr:CHAT domain-containing protein [Candidatus Helarchaeota archaeon]